jgi:hypothetical protein
MAYSLQYDAAVAHVLQGLSAEFVDATQEPTAARFRVMAQTGAVPPPVLQDRIPYWQAVCGEQATLWIENPGTGVISPLPCALAVAEAVQDGETSAMVSLLAQQQVLLTAESYAQREQAWQRNVQSEGRRFQEQGYAVLRQLLGPIERLAMRQHHRWLWQDGYLQHEPGGDRLTLHNESVARYFHHQITPAVEVVIGERIKPSYCYTAAYLPGATLVRHTDREQCVWNVSYLVDTVPDHLSPSQQWPIDLASEAGYTSVNSQVGDGVLFRGDVPHGRPRLASDRSEGLIFFHFVPVGFTGGLD